MRQWKVHTREQSHLGECKLSASFRRSIWERKGKSVFKQRPIAVIWLPPSYRFDYPKNGRIPLFCNSNAFCKLLPSNSHARNARGLISNSEQRWEFAPKPLDCVRVIVFFSFSDLISEYFSTFGLLKSIESRPKMSDVNATSLGHKVRIQSERGI